ncbi:hypothetical protein ASPBRDRAFT_56806 [Aspergillus brasiliensis CBS 101740]|uniref:Uncharacterized protein n=1 Tax=Aspergillus brasiliensis (strain CBS 101740 / IMI 381727 / IBT 21946) TaxID=767769 RepID=A0A1L9UEK6_ASPBC|nr:hypothetical protein ASPBRDRAFT_56806 [Aspergillus brasiliensis CBS 101740]
MDRRTPTPNSQNAADKQWAEEHGYLNYHEVVPGWTDDPRALRHFFRPGTPEWYQARSYGIIDATLVLLGTNNSGEMAFIIKSMGRYYIGDLMIDDIFEISRPKRWPAILRVMEERGAQALGLKTLKHVELPDDEDLPEVEVPEGENLYVPIGQDATSIAGQGQ